MQTNTLLLISFLTITNLYCFGQVEAVDVAELTLKVGALSTEEIYYGFAEGDEIVFNFEEVKGKPLKEIEIIELPTNSKYMDYKSVNVTDKKIEVHKTAVYKFSFRNTAMIGRICKIKIQRIPKSEDMISFNTNWEWKTLYDTTYVPYTQDSIVGYDTTYIPYTKKELVKVDTNVIEKTKTERIHTYLNPKGDRSVVSFELPKSRKSTYMTSEVISWAYWFGTNGAPKVSNEIKIAGKLSKISPVAGLALGFWGLVKSTGGRNLNYGILDSKESANLYLNKMDGVKGYDWGDGSSSSNQVTDWYNTTFYIGFDNDQVYAVDVDVIVSVVLVTKTYEDKQYKRQKVTARKVTLNKKRMVVKTDKVRVNAG